MTVDEPRLPAGWYPDPEAPAGQRWWNGSQWTLHTRPGDRLHEMIGTEGRPPLAWSSASGPLATVSESTPTGTSVHAPVDADPPMQQSPPWMPSIQPGWYADPSGLPVQRWWDGQSWSAHTAPLPSGLHLDARYGNTTVVTLPAPKSVGVAFLLTFLFGPLGMLYSTVSGALIMMGIAFFGGLVVGIMTLGLAWLVWGPAVWIASMIWGCAAASSQRPVQVVTAYR